MLNDESVEMFYAIEWLLFRFRSLTEMGNIHQPLVSGTRVDPMKKSIEATAFTVIECVCRTFGSHPKYVYHHLSVIEQLKMDHRTSYSGVCVSCVDGRRNIRRVPQTTRTLPRHSLAHVHWRRTCLTLP